MSPAPPLGSVEGTGSFRDPWARPAVMASEEPDAGEPDVTGFAAEVVRVKVGAPKNGMVLPC